MGNENQNKVVQTFLRYVLPAALATVGSIVIGYLKYRSGYEDLAKNYNTLVEDAKTDHDMIIAIKGNVDMLSRIYINGQQPSPTLRSRSLRFNTIPELQKPQAEQNLVPPSILFKDSNTMLRPLPTTKQFNAKKVDTSF